jgi:hypothetical protein
LLSFSPPQLPQPPLLVFFFFFFFFFFFLLHRLIFTVLCPQEIRGAP